MARKPYPHQEIEKRAQEKWERLELHKTNLNDRKDPYYTLVEFPYPSGDLHVGHWYAFAVTDIFARMKKAQGKNVLFPIGFDAFGLPAENAAMKNGDNPEVWTYQNMERMRTQIRTMGTILDWSKEVVTCDPAYYKWTQWLFERLFEKGLAYRDTASVKWCPKDKTVLANEQVVDGACERCGTEVEEKRLTQWFMKITDYADRLLNDLDLLPWKEEIKEAQRAWIGKSEGARISFPLTFKKKPEDTAWRDHEGNPAQIEVFTTRPDTIFGATYVVLAPEHPWVRAVWDTPHDDAVFNKEEVREYVEASARKTERERSENKEKTGVRLDGINAINPATKEEIPVYVADYVLGSYGTGAVMAVPAHDERDYAFATKHDLPMIQVVVPCAPDPLNPPQKGFEEVKRDTVIVHIKDKSTGKYALLKWHGSLEGINTAIMGGIEEGQTPEEAALAEIKEEAALEGVTLTKRLRWITAARYCASHKQQNRCAHTYTFLAEVESLANQGAIDSSEQALHTLVWVDESEMLRSLTPAHQKQVWQLLNQEVALTGDGYLINSGEFDGRDNTEVMWDIVERVGGTRETQYRLRDWLVSRQRYWGCPIPIVYDPEGNAHVIPEEHLPWKLPTDVSFASGDASPLASSQELRDRVTSIFGEGWIPEVDTLDTFVDSSWYFSRYLAPDSETEFADKDQIEKWLPVNRYSGGAEHTTMHLLYSRFFTKALFDLGLLPVSEPFTERYNRGLILGPDGQKMSKSKGNVLNPDEFVVQYGADSIRTYLAFIGPYNEPGNYPWKPEGLFAMRKFLERVDRLAERVSDTPVTEAEQKALARATERIGDSLERFKTNTAVSGLMILMNSLEEGETVSKEAYRTLLILLAPFAPHLADHLYEGIGEMESVHQEPWPEVDPALLAEETVIIGVQVAGKLRGEIHISPEASEEEAVSAALALPKVGDALGGGNPSRVIYKAGRILNLIP